MTAGRPDAILDADLPALVDRRARDRQAHRPVTSLDRNVHSFDALELRLSDHLHHTEIDAVVSQVHAGALARHQDEAELATRACERGGTVIEAGDAAVRDLHAAAQPLADALAADPVTRDLMVRISELAAETQRSAGAAPCEAGSTPAAGTEDEVLAASEPEVGYRGTELLPEGTFRAELAADELEAAGMPRHLAYANAGVWTMVIDGSRWELVHPKPERCTGTQEVVRDVVRFTTTVADPCAMEADVQWRPEDDGLSLRVVGLAWSDDPAVIAQEAAWYDRIWTRIDEAD